MKKDKHYEIMRTENFLLAETNVPSNTEILKQDQIRETIQNQIREAKKNTQAKRKRIWLWFCGNPFKKWFRSPNIIGSGFILIITLMLLIIPFTGFITVPSVIDTQRDIQFTSNQTVSWDGYYATKSEFLSAGNKISYNISSNNPVSLMVLNKSLINLPFTNTHYTGIYNGSINSLLYNSIPFLLKKGDSLNYSYTLKAGSVEKYYSTLNNGSTVNTSNKFFIVDRPTWKQWYFSSWFSYTINNNGVITQSSYKLPTNNFNYVNISSSQNNGSFVAPYTQEWYLVFANVLDFAMIGSFSIQYNISSLDQAKASLNILNVQNIAQAFTAPSSGTYTFLIYNSPKINTNNITSLVSSDIIFHQNINGNEFWARSAPFLVFIAILTLSLIMITLIQRSSISKSTKQHQKEKTEVTKKQVSITKDEPRSCPSCGTVNASQNFFCESCGSKLKKGTYTAQEQIQVSADHYCSVCGSGLLAESKYCPQCGNETE